MASWQKWKLQMLAFSSWGKVFTDKKFNTNEAVTVWHHFSNQQILHLLHSFFWHLFLKGFHLFWNLLHPVIANNRSSNSLRHIFFVLMDLSSLSAVLLRFPIEFTAIKTRLHSPQSSLQILNTYSWANTGFGFWTPVLLLMY